MSDVPVMNGAPRATQEWPAGMVMNEEAYRAAVVNRLSQIVRNESSRSEMWRRLMDPRRDIYSECGYPPNAEGVDSQLCWDLHVREAVAARVNELYPKECFQVQPLVYEDEDSDTATEFEEAWDSLGETIRGEFSWYKEEKGSPVMSALLEADINCGIGRYGIILIGFDDGKTLDQPVVRAKGSKRLKVTYLRTFTELSAPVASYEQDSASPRLGQPTSYNLHLGDSRDGVQSATGGPGTVVVHWSRVIHVVDNSGMPRLAQVLNNVLGIQKISCGSPEMYWKAAFFGISWETHPQLGGDVVVDKAGMKDELEKMWNSLQRDVITSGMTAKPLAPAVVDPTPYIEIQIQLICIKLGCPVRVFKGSERGELASSQDDAAWNDRLKQRQDNHLTANLVVPFVDRLIMVGVLPEPTDGYYVEWPDITSKDETEQSTTAGLKVTAMAGYVSGGVDAIMSPMDFYVEVMGFDEDRARAIIDNAAESSEEKQAADLDAQAEAIDRGLAPDPTQLPFDPNGPPEGPPEAFP